MTVAATITIARRFLFGGGRLAAFSRRTRGGVIGVGLSLIPLVVVLQVADGMIAGITTRYLETGSFHVQGISRSPGAVDGLAASIAAAGSVDGVRLVVAERQGIGLAAGDDARTAVTIRAVEPDLYARDPGLRRYLEIRSGEWDLDSPNSIVVGEYVARRLGVAVGDTLRILTARQLASGRFLPRSASFVVRAIVSAGYADLDRLWVFIPFDRGTAILPDESSRLIVGIKMESPLDLPNPIFSSGARADRDRASAALTELRGLFGDRFRVVTWFESNRAQFMSFKTTKDLLVFIMVLIVMVAAVNISSTLVMLVLEKQEEIAVLKSIGASPRAIRRVFIVCGFVLGTLGALAGLSIGLFFAVNINEVLYALEWVLNAVGSAARWIVSPIVDLPGGAIELLSPEFYIEHIPIAIRFADVLLVAFLTILLSTAAAWFPAQRASRIRPLEVLRKH